MNQKLIQFIELCLVDGIITEKEREVIFRKSNELGVPEDECEIILQGMIHKSSHVDEKVKENISSFLDEESIEKIEKLDIQVISGFVNYIKSVEDKLIEVSSSDFINNSFRKWYKNLPKNLVKGKTSFSNEDCVYYKTVDSRNGINNLQFYTGNEYWMGSKIKLEHFKNSNEEFIGIKSQILGSNIKYDRLFTTKGVYEVILTEVKNLFSPKYLSGKTRLLKSIDTIDIEDYNDKKVQESLWSLLIHFDNESSIYDPFIKIYKSLDISINPKNIIEFLPDKEIFGDDLVVKLSNHIRNLIEQFKNHISSTNYKDLIPVCVIGIKRRGPNPNLFKILELNLLTIKYISNLIHLRNQLLISVLKRDRLSVKFIGEQLDDLGIMMNFYEKKKLDKMDETIIVLKNGFNQLTDVLSELSSNISNLNSSITTGLIEINENLKFNNILSLINTYQTFKINKNTK